MFIIDIFSVLKYCMLIALFRVAENFCVAIFMDGLTTSLLMQNLFYKTRIRYGNESDRSNVSSVKKAPCKTSIYKLLISRNLV